LSTGQITSKNRSGDYEKEAGSFIAHFERELVAEEDN